MRIPRIYYPSSLVLNEHIILNEISSGHLLRVLRLKVGSSVIVFDGIASGEYSATLVEIEKNKAVLKVEFFSAKENESPLSIHLGQGISRGDKMDYTLQKSVELGVMAITPLLTERCGVELKGDRLEKRMDHWRGIIIHACEQSGRIKLPALHSPQKLIDWFQSLKVDIGFVTDPRSSKRLSEFENNLKSAALLCGPEGGLSESEIALAHAQGLMGLSLGPRILRTETAALTAITLLQQRWGDF